MKDATKNKTHAHPAIALRWRQWPCLRATAMLTLVTTTACGPEALATEPADCAPVASAAPAVPYPIGLYCVNEIYGDPPEKAITDDFADIAQAGFDWVQSYRFELAAEDGNTDEAAGEYLDAAESAGLRVLLGFELYHNQLDEHPLDEQIDRLRERVEAFRDHPALFAWNIADEPDNDDYLVDPSVLQAIYRAVKESDPTHPVAITTLNAIKGSSLYLDAFDFMIPYGWPSPFVGTEQYRSELIESLGVVGPRGKTQMPNVWVFNPADDPWVCPPDYTGAECLVNRLPEAHEIRFIAYDALILGASGLSFLCYRNRYDESDPGYDISPKADPDQWQAVASVASELHELGPVLLEDPVEPTVAGISIDGEGEVMVKTHCGHTYLFTTNPSADPVARRIQLDPDKFPAPQMWLLPERRSLDLVDHSLEDSWQPFEARVYEVAPM